MFRIALAAAAVAFLAPSATLASSPAAWDAFAKDVRDKCLAAAQAAGMKTPEVVVHPLGTETYGLAVLREAGDKRICVYGKEEGRADAGHLRDRPRVTPP
jgi:hypothetical protein